MSWAYFKTGKAEHVREDAEKVLTATMDYCKNIPAERASIANFQSTVLAVCDSAEGQAIKVSGNGTAWLVDDKLRGFSFTASIEVIDLTGTA